MLQISNLHATVADKRILNGLDLTVDGFAPEGLKQLLMEFAVEARKLLSISLENSVG